jgi:DNA-binding GntR family transcriptional regulator
VSAEPNGAVPRVQWIIERIRTAIVSGEFPPGSKLRAEELASAWHVSPTPVREAFQRLAAEGLVDYSQQRGVRVVEATRKDMTDLYDIRRRLEPWALERSMARADRAALESIRLRHKELNAWYSDRTTDLASPQYENAHQAFHHALIASCDSEWLIRLVGTLSMAATRYRNIAHRSTSDVARPARPEIHLIARRGHRELARAVLAGDVDRALTAQHAHLDGMQARVIASFDAEEPA